MHRESFYPARLLVIALGFFFLQTSAQAEVDNPSTTSPVSPIPAAEPAVPRLESTEIPNGSYSMEDEILYKVKVSWNGPVEDVRMSSPDIQLENLELLGVSQESVSGNNEQILTLRFKPLRKGVARIRSTSLKWAVANGTATTELKVPPVELAIKSSPKESLKWIGLSGGLALVCLLLFVASTKLKKQKIESIPEKSSEEIYLDKIQSLKNSGQVQSSKEYFQALNHCFEQYVSHKWNWNRGQEGYNALLKTVEEKYSKKEAHELKEIFDKLEYIRYSGSAPSTNEVNSVYEILHSFIERKKVIT